MLHRAHSRVKSRGQGGCDMLWPEISTEMHKSVKSCFELVAPYDLTSCVYTLQNVAKAFLKLHLDFYPNQNFVATFSILLSYSVYRYLLSKTQQLARPNWGEGQLQSHTPQADFLYKHQKNQTLSHSTAIVRPVNNTWNIYLRTHVDLFIRISLESIPESQSWRQWGF